MNSYIHVVYARETPDGFLVTANVGPILKSERVTFLRDAENPEIIRELHRNRSIGAQWRILAPSRHPIAIAAFRQAEEV
jgi:hypothetical protein